MIGDSGGNRASKRNSRKHTQLSARDGASTGMQPAESDNFQQKDSSEVNPWTGRPFSGRYHEILRSRQTLPIWESRKLLLAALKEKKVVVLEGETGSGKTTQVPQFLVEAGLAESGAIICCTQPRRVAALSVAKRVAQEMDVKLGDEVGYSVRFDEKSSSRTVLKYLTDGTLLREAMTDNMLERYSVIVLDEAHERTLSTDILMGLLKSIVRKRSNLRVVIMSATMDTKKFQNFFDNAPLLKVPGRMFPVEIFYSSEPEVNYVDAAVRTAVEICENEPAGDILVFLTGEQEIEEVCARIEWNTRENGHRRGPVLVLPLYGALPPDIQQRVFEPAPEPTYPGGPPGRKVVCATNIAETSLTIDGVVYVIDPGFAKQKIYNPRGRVESLHIDSISQASAKQRTGRAGRTRPGKCFRLYTKDAFDNELQKTSYPEILRSNLGNVVLQLKKLNVDDLVHFDFMDPPAPESMMRALELLNYLGAIDDEGDLTSFGSLMSSFPLDPESAACLIRSVDFNCSEDILSVVSMLSEAQNCFVFSKGRKLKRDHRGKNIQQNSSPRAQFADRQCDHMTYLNVYHAYKQSENSHNWCRENFINPRALRSADNVRRQLSDMMRKNGLQLLSTPCGTTEFSSNIRKALLSGYFMQVAHIASKQNYFTVKDNERVSKHPSSGVRRNATWIMYHEHVVSDEKRFVRTCCEIEGKWLLEIAPHYYDLSNFPAGAAKDSLRRLHKAKEMTNSLGEKMVIS